MSRHPSLEQTLQTSLARTHHRSRLLAVLTLARDHPHVSGPAVTTLIQTQPPRRRPRRRLGQHRGTHCSRLTRTGSDRSGSAPASAASARSTARDRRRPGRAAGERRRRLRTDARRARPPRSPPRHWPPGPGRPSPTKRYWPRAATRGRTPGSPIEIGASPSSRPSPHRASPETVSPPTCNEHRTKAWTSTRSPA